MANAKRAEKRTFHNIGLFVRVSRLDAGLSQTALARELGFRNGQFVSNVERGLCSIPEHKIAHTAEILKVSPYTLIKHMVRDYQLNLSGAVVEAGER